jgi:hypothetical protein
VEFPLILSAEANRIILSKYGGKHKNKNKNSAKKRVGTIITLIMFVRVKL